MIMLLQSMVLSDVTNTMGQKLDADIQGNLRSLHDSSAVLNNNFNSKLIIIFSI